ncbi:MAG: PD-(D/E)XK nuclease family protein [Pontimonas sp.]
MTIPPEQIAQLPPHARTLVVGAPGSGKTTLLVERLVALHQSGISPDRLMIVTPSRSQASRVRDVVGLSLGTTTAGARAQSLQAFAFALVSAHHRAHGLAEPDLVKARVVDRDSEDLLKGHIDDQSGPQWPEPLGDMVRTTPTFRTELREWMARAAEHGITTERAQELAERHSKPEWLAAAQFRDELVAVMASARPGAFGSAEIVRRATQIVREALPPGWESLVHVCVDDAHDLSFAGLELLDALAERGMGLTVVSEPDVAGNTFRGSEPAGIMELQTRWGVSPTILPSVYRHGEKIRSLVQSVTSRIGTAGAGTQRQAASVGEGHGSVQTILSPSASREASDIARIVWDAHHRDLIPLDHIAVVARRGSRVTSLTRALATAGIPARSTMVGMALLDEPAAKGLVEIAALGRGLRSLTPASAVAALTGLYGAMTGQELRRLRFAMLAQASAEEPHQPADQMICDALAHRGGFAMLEREVAGAAARLAETLDDIRNAPSHTPVSDILWRIWDNSSTAALWQDHATGRGSHQASADRALDAVVARFRQAADFAESSPGESHDIFLEALLEAEIPDDVIIPEPAWPAVTVSTPSAVAGREFNLVVVSGVEDQVWPDLRLRESLLGAHRMVYAHRDLNEAILDERRSVLEDELRMFALAISRAKSRVVVCATEDEESGPSPLFSVVDALAERLQSTPQGPLSERVLVGQLRRKLVLAEGTAEAAQLASDLAVLAADGVPGADPEVWWGLTPPSTEEPLYSEGTIPISPSALATLESSPLEWFLGTVAKNDPSPERGLGSLIHRAWEDYPGGDAQTLWSAVETRFTELEFDAGWIEAYQRRLARSMVSALAEYISDHAQEGWEVIASEQRFQYTHQRAVITGYIDRIERTPDGRVMVVDLKTGTHKTDSAVVDDPQLSAYQLALLADEVKPLVGEEAVSAGASLLFVKSGVRGKAYRLATQPPLGEDGMQAFMERIEAAAAIMNSAHFSGVPLSYGPAGTPSRHRWHFVGAVCSDA